METDYLCVQVRFLFSVQLKAGSSNYTVEYCLGTRTWYIFKGEEKTNALAFYPVKERKPVLTRVDIARSYLQKYFDEKA